MRGWWRLIVLGSVVSGAALAAPLPPHFDEDQLAGLHPRDWNFHSREDANIRLYLDAITVTEYEGPFLVKDKFLRQLLQAGVPADNYYGCNVLAAAAHTRNLPAVREMLAARAPVQSPPTRGFRNYENCDALAEGLHGGNPAIVALLLQRHPDVNKADGGGDIPLEYLTLGPAYVPGTPVIPGRGPAYQKWLLELDRNRATMLRMMLAAGADPRRNTNSQNPFPVEKRFQLKKMSQTRQVMDAWLAAHPQKPH